MLLVVLVQSFDKIVVDVALLAEANPSSTYLPALTTQVW